MRVLLVETHPIQAKALSALFSDEGVGVEHTENSADVLGLLRHYPFDLIVLNLLLSDVDGNLLISRIRTAGHHTPILAMAGPSSAKLRQKAFAMGADDIVEFNTDSGELLARMRAIVRRSRGYSQPLLRAGALVLDLERQDVMVGESRVCLTVKEFALLQLLMLRKNMVMTKETILANLYGGIDEPEIKIIDVFVCKLRNKLAKAGVNGVIETVWGRGYTVRDRDEQRRQSPVAPACPQPNETMLRAVLA